RAELRLRPPRCDRDRVEEAKAHRAARLRVMPRWAGEGEAAAPHRFDRGARGEESRFVARLRAERVVIEPPARGAHAVDECGRVAAQDVLLRRRRAFDEREALVQRRDAGLRLRMVAGRMQRREAWIADELDGATIMPRDALAADAGAPSHPRLRAPLDGND